MRVIKAFQQPPGNWSSNEGWRPPMNAGEYQGAALAIYAIKTYAPIGDEASSAEAVAHAAAWLERSNPQGTQDRAFHMLGLACAKPGSEVARRAAGGLAAMQRPDGWSQMPTMESDTYATGQVLHALHAAGGMAVTDPHQKGLDFLLRKRPTARGT